MLFCLTKKPSVINTYALGYYFFYLSILQHAIAPCIIFNILDLVIVLVDQKKPFKSINFKGFLLFRGGVKGSDLDRLMYTIFLNHQPLQPIFSNLPIWIYTF